MSTGNIPTKMTCVMLEQVAMTNPGCQKSSQKLYGGNLLYDALLGNVWHRVTQNTTDNKNIKTKY